VVDKDQDMLSMLQRTFKVEGFDTVIVADGNDALRLMQRIEPDLVILDEAALGSDRLKVVDRMREQSDAPIIMLTQDYEIEALREALSHGADDYIRKPFGTKCLIARVRAKMRRAAMQMA
jgi:two-component system, OmpR family, response regulator MtrA